MLIPKKSGFFLNFLFLMFLAPLISTFFVASIDKNVRSLVTLSVFVN